MWKLFLLTTLMFSSVPIVYALLPRSSMKHTFLVWILMSLGFATLHHIVVRYVVREGFDYMPDSHKTTCAAGSVPAENGLDCKLPTDIYGL